MKIYAIETDDGYFVTANLKTGSYNKGTGIERCLINGEETAPAFHDNWRFVESKPLTIEKKVRQPNINHRYELVDDSFVNNDIPKMMPKHEVMETSEDGYCGWKEEFKHLSSLYEEKSDPQPDTLESLEFELQTVFKIPSLMPVDGFSYEVFKSKWEHEGTRQIKEDEITHQFIDRLVFPEIVLQETPSKFSSKKSYDIIRHHVKQYINLDVAEITSDYNFCFTVKKLVALKTPCERKNEILTSRGKSYKNRKWRKWWVKSRHVEIFEMTHAENRYQGYTSVKGFEGKTHRDLKKNIDKYLKELMKTINEPLTDCPYCDGMGVILTISGDK